METEIKIIANLSDEQSDALVREIKNTAEMIGMKLDIESSKLIQSSDITSYLSAKKAKEMTIEAQKEKASKEYDTKCVLEQIEEATKNGSFEIQTYDDDKIRQNLVLLGYKCSDPFKSWNDVYMKVNWL